MNILSVDLGTYSVKLIEANVDTRKSSIVRKTEVTLSSATDQLPQGLSTRELHFEIIKRYIKANNFNGKLIFQAPNNILTRRFLKLPTNSKRKAEMMLPFQLDNSLPYQASEAHYTTTFSPKQKSMNVTMDISYLGNFDQFYSQLIQLNIRPSILTSELSAMNAMAKINKRKDNYIVIDLGHATTKVYFISNQDVISSHVSYVAGSVINEAISQTYNIPLNDATLYKHDNCFMLTEGQYNEVTEDQAEFANLMKNIFTPFISDFKRWEIAQRINTGGSFEQVYLIGGTSNIKNLPNFLKQQLSHHVEQYKVDTHFKKQLHMESLPKSIHYSLATIMAIAAPTSGLLSSFLMGQYTSGGTQAVSAHSTMFVAFRVALVSLCIAFSLFIEGIFLQQQDKKINVFLEKRIQLVTELTKPQQMLYKKNPDKLLNTLKSKTKSVESELNLLKKTTKTNAIAPLFRLSELVKSNKNVTLQEFSTDHNQTTASFTSDNIKELEILQKHLKTSSSIEMHTELKQHEKLLVINFTEENR